MNVCVEISDDQVAEFLRQSVEMCMSGALPTRTPIPPHQMSDLITSIEICVAMNKIIRYLGGVEVDLADVKPHNRVGE
jgi:hypothetical protein